MGHGHSRSKLWAATWASRLPFRNTPLEKQKEKFKLLNRSSQQETKEAGHHERRQLVGHIVDGPQQHQGGGPLAGRRRVGQTRRVRAAGRYKSARPK